MLNKPATFFIALYMIGLTCTNRILTASETESQETAIAITIGNHASKSVPVKTDLIISSNINTNNNQNALDSVNNNGKVLAPAQAGGAIVTPAFQYAIKAADFATPTASWTSGATPTAGSVMYTINNSGRYYLASDVAARVNNSYTNTVMLYINCSNVILDLNSKSLYPAGNTTGQNTGPMTAILVAPNVSNVVITNGQINGFQPNNTLSYLTSGIMVSAGCSNITISNLNVANIGGDNLDTLVTSIAVVGIEDESKPCSNISLQNISVSNTNNTLDNTVVAGLALNFCKNVKINGCTFEGSKATGANSISYGAFFFQCNTISFDHCSANQTGLGATNIAYAFFSTQSDNLSFTNCEALQTTGTITIGFYLLNTVSCTAKLINCSTSNGTSSDTFTGFYIQGGTAILQNCAAENNTATNACLGIELTSTEGGQLINCRANQNSSTSSNVIGIFLNGASSTLCNNCTANGNNGTTAVYGIDLASSPNCQLNNCIANENYTTGNSKVVGFLTNSDGSMLNGCVANHNYNSNSSNSNLTAGFSFESVSGNQFFNCQARDNQNASLNANAIAAGFYSLAGTASQFTNCQAINNTLTNANTTGKAAGIMIDSGVNNQIVNCNCSANTTGTGATGVASGIYLASNSSNTLVQNCDLNFNVGALNFGFYDDAHVGGLYPTKFTGASSSILINNRAIGQGRCFPLPGVLDSNYAGAYEFGSNTSMNYFFYMLGDIGEDPNMMINETDNYNWKVLSTAVPDWSNISVVIGQL